MYSGAAIRVTVSIGIASTERAGYDFQDLMKAADAALYEAKARGRDRVEDETAQPRHAIFRERLAS